MTAESQAQAHIAALGELLEATAQKVPASPRAELRSSARDDDAGHEFAKVYKSAASTTLDKMGFSALVMSETGRGLMHTAREFMAGESHIASQILGQQVDMTDGMGDPYEDCEESFLGRGQEFKGSSETRRGTTSTRREAGAAGSGDRPRSCATSPSRGAAAGS